MHGGFFFKGPNLFSVLGEVNQLILVYFADSRGRTYVMITYISKENNLGPGDKIRYIWGLKGPIFIL